MFGRTLIVVSALVALVFATPLPVPNGKLPILLS